MQMDFFWFYAILSPQSLNPSIKKRVLYRGYTKEATLDRHPSLSALHTDRFSEPSVQASFQNFTKTLLFNFPDTKQTYVLSVVNGNATIEEKSITNPDTKATSNTEVLVGIMDKKVNPITAYMTRKVKAQGVQEDLMRLQSLMM
jgi:SCP-2 sterol transfer family protein